MAQFFNLIFLCCAAILAYLLSQFFYEMHKKYQTWCELNYADDFQAHKQNKLYNKAYDCYLTQIENRPDLKLHIKWQQHTLKRLLSVAKSTNCIQK